MMHSSNCSNIVNLTQARQERELTLRTGSNNMPRANESAFLTQLANLFRAQGDTATANALVCRHKSTRARSISDDDHRRVLGLQRKGRLLDNRGAHEESMGWFSGALMLIEDALGPNHAGIIEHLDDVARCRFNDGDYESALPHYLRLLRLVEFAYGNEDELASTVRYRIQDCWNGKRTGDGVRRLQVQMSVMLR
jgi:tetratricopeptide (TPR) repeat protein